MLRSYQKMDFVVFAPSSKAPFSVMQVPSADTDVMVENRVIQREGESLAPDKTIGDTAYIRVKFNDAASAQDAANIARDQKLVYIPQNFIVGLRNRRPDLGMGDIRVEFGRRSAEATAQKDPVSHATARQIDAIRDVLDALSDVDWADIDRSDAYTIPRRNPR